MSDQFSQYIGDIVMGLSSLTKDISQYKQLLQKEGGSNPESESAPDFHSSGGVQIMPMTKFKASKEELIDANENPQVEAIHEKIQGIFK